MKKNFDSGDRESPSNHRSSAEWISFTIALILLGIVVGLITYSWIIQDYKPPILEVETSSQIRQVNDQFYVPFTVTNQGGTTVASVEIVAELRFKGEVQQQGSQQISFLSSGEVQSGAFIFSHNPQAGQLVVRVASYQLP
jgi:uncharacterized protein (TIGR02588 family)